jgi:hypothetical protein
MHGHANPKSVSVEIEELVDSRLIRKLHETGFIHQDRRDLWFEITT